MALVEIDPLTGAVETYEYDRSTGAMSFTKSLNVDPILDMNAAVRNDSGDYWRGEDNSVWHVASVPLITLQDWLHEFNAVRGPGDKVKSIYAQDAEWDRFVLMRLDSNDHYKLKVAPVKIL